VGRKSADSPTDADPRMTIFRALRVTFGGIAGRRRGQGWIQSVICTDNDTVVALSCPSVSSDGERHGSKAASKS
jgi:hypothetical protein